MAVKASLRSAAELAADKPHGVRLRYMAGCRCVACRKANSAYENERQKARRAGDWNGIVDAAEARAHMLKLRRQGVGRRTVQACTDIADTVLQEIVSGKKQRIRARTARLILQVTRAQAADHALVRAGRSKRLIALLLEEEYTEAFLAERLGYANGHLQFTARMITVRNAARIERLYKELTT
ncbi:MAG TPA: hypothetical protein VGE36_11405 [Roseateles sp.]